MDLAQGMPGRLSYATMTELSKVNEDDALRNTVARSVARLWRIEKSIRLTGKAPGAHWATDADALKEASELLASFHARLLLDTIRVEG